LTAIQPVSKFGPIKIHENNEITGLPEEQGWVNGSFMVFNPEVVDLSRYGSTAFKRDTLKEGGIGAVLH